MKNKVNKRDEKKVVASTKTEVKITWIDRVYGYGSLIILGAGTVYTGVHLVNNNQELIAAGASLLVLFCMRSILRLFK